MVTTPLQDSNAARPQRKVVHSHPDPDERTSADEEASEEDTDTEEEIENPVVAANVTKWAAASFPSLADFYKTGIFKPDFDSTEGKVR